MWAESLQNVVATRAVSPYLNPLAGTGAEELKRMLAARVDFDAPPDAAQAPMLLVGAVDVLSGDFKAFNSRRERITADAAPSPARRSRSPTGATSCRATCRCSRSCASSRRSINCSRRGRCRRTAKYRPIAVRVIEPARARLSGAFGVVSKLDRDPAFAGLMAHGEERAEESWPRWPSSARGGRGTSRRPSTSSPRTPGWRSGRRSAGP
ncbi:MAG TPA: hypothetical protein VN213_12835 [Solirubrobacteraceae bacterium]|nr:hypothetical protein [Solirubrobacteraceae bacterium]